jgi:hypothetical protein
MRPRTARRFSRAAALALGLVTPSVVVAADPSAVVVLALDTSGSLQPSDLARARELALGLLNSLPAGSEVAVFTFDDESRLLLGRTSDAEAVRRAIGEVTIRGRYTSLHDALYDASRYLAAAPGRKGIVLVTDGLDENSALKLDDGLRLAQETGIPVVAVGVGRVQERVLRRIAKLTGGAYLPARRATGPTLAARLLEAGDTPASSASATPVVSPSTPPPTRPASDASAPSPGSPASGSSGSRRMLTLAAVGGTAAVGGLALLLLRRRRRRVCPACGHELAGPLATCTFCEADLESGGPLSGKQTMPVQVSDTVLERLSSTEEYLEKTVTLRERPVLAVTRGPGAGQVFPLSSATAMSMGRAKANDIVLEDVAVSSEHCRIRPEDGRYVVHDLRSTNGTFVNERRISRHTLSEGDLIKVGETWLQFRTDQQRD